MPIRLTIYHPDRLVIALASGNVTFADIVGYGREIEAAGVIHYRKILDVIDAHPALSEEELGTIVELVRAARTDKRRGALAFVADRNRGQFAKLFSSIEIDGRPAAVFSSIHDAKRWLAKNPPEND